MGNSNSAHKISAQDRAILDLKLQRDKLQQQQKKLTTISAREKEVAAYHLSQGDRKRALLALRRKKYQESLILKTDAQLAQLQALTSDVEFALVQKDVVFGLQQGTKVLKELRAQVGGIEEVEKLMGNSEEERAFQEEVAGILDGKITVAEEEEVDEEIDALEREQEGIQTGNERRIRENGAVRKSPEKMPNAPEGEIMPEPPDGLLEGQEQEQKAVEKAQPMLA